MSAPPPGRVSIASIVIIDFVRTRPVRFSPPGPVTTGSGRAKLGLVRLYSTGASKYVWTSLKLRSFLPPPVLAARALDVRLPHSADSNEALEGRLVDCLQGCTYRRIVVVIFAVAVRVRLRT